MYILVYVDDIIITGCKLTNVQSIIQKLSARFSLKDLGPLSYFLGTEVTRKSDCLVLSQCKYIADMIRESHMQDSNGIQTLISTAPPLTITSGDPIVDHSEYRRIVGKLQYLSLTRPDISFAVNKLSQFITVHKNLTGKR